MTTTAEVQTKLGNGSFQVETSSLPTKLPNDFLSDIPRLTHEQAGHLRHFHNLATQPDGEWRHMGSQDPGQEWLDAYRYQLATMAYAAGVAHYHRLSALRSVFKALLEQLIHKMLRREVWGYWYLTSQSGKFVNPDLVELRKPWADPNKKENIMYSGHLLLMVSLHAMLFDDDKYDQPDALTFNWDPIFWGFGPEKFTYSRSDLQQAILAEMEREGWKGVCCEPNSIFVICNQFPIIAMRYNDIRQGTEIVDEVLKKYTAAWDAVNGFVQEDKHIVRWYMVEQDRVVPGSVSTSAWASAFMNSWNSEFVHSLYPDQSLGFLTHAPDGRITVNDESVADTIRALAKNENADPYSWDTMQKAREIAAQAEPRRSPPYQSPKFGYIAKWVSEVADPATCQGLLLHADKFLNPQWERGGLFYPRNTIKADDKGNWTSVDPFTSNAAIAYARLNVSDGQRKMWEHPWPKGHSLHRPFVDGLGLDSDIDFLRGVWEPEKNAMILTMRTWDGSKKTARALVQNLPSGKYGIYKDGILLSTHDIPEHGNKMELVIEVGAEESNIVVLKEVCRK